MGKAQDFLKQAASSSTDECILWPYTKYPIGYGQVRFNGYRTSAHRASLILATGKNPADKDAAHTCRNRACVNPRHLFWASRSENILQKHLDGSFFARGKRTLRPEDICPIRKRYALHGDAASIAKDYGVCRDTIYAITSGRTWRHVKCK